jgi:hypothetical protein
VVDFAHVVSGVEGSSSSASGRAGAVDFGTIGNVSRVLELED